MFFESPFFKAVAVGRQTKQVQLVTIGRSVLLNGNYALCNMNCFQSFVSYVTVCDL